MQRDGRTRKQVKHIMENQLPDDKKRMFADFIINNDDNTLILPTILQIHNKLIKKREDLKNG
jgi:dephospho-CoA kinase